jgi:hypothetical protein
MLAAALIRPSQTLAQTRKATCPTTASRGKAKSNTAACDKSRHKRKGKRHDAGKHPAKHATAKLPNGVSPATVEAFCEDGSAPVRAHDGSFSCEDGSEPLCEDGATPVRSKNGTRLVCHIFSEEEASAAEVECEEAESSTCEADSGTGEEPCEVSASDSTGAVCEGEDES